MGYPFGVVGPFCEEGNQNILNHDFTARLHMDIFGMNYYPPELVDWWMDDWISSVYGDGRTRMLENIEVMCPHSSTPHEILNA